MPVRQQDAIESLEPEPTAQYLALRPLAAIDQETILSMKQERRRQPAPDRRRRRRRAQKTSSNISKHGSHFTLS